MTRVPRDVSGDLLAKKLAKLGYSVMRQSGSHIILTTLRHGEHHVSVPRHNPIQAGTLNKLLRLVAQHHGCDRDELIDMLSL